MKLKKFLMVIALVAISATAVRAADATWTGATSGAWRTTGNWSPAAFPGSSTSTSNTDIVTISNSTQPTMGINFNNVTNGVFSFGGINFGNGTARELNNSSGTVTGNLTLNGATINSVSNVIIRNSGSGTFTFNGTANSGMGVILGGSNNVVSVDGTGNVVFTANMTGTSSKLSLNATNSGDLRLSGNNSFTGGIDVFGGTSGGRLRIDAVAALPTTGTVAISTGGRITLNVAGTYGGTAQALTFNPNQTTNPSLDILSGAAVTWQGTVAINADTRIEANGATGSLTFSGNMSGSGTLIKQAAGTLNLNGTANTATGGTQIGNGAIVVGASSKLGTGDLTMFQTSTNNTALTLNNSTQTIGNLSSSFTATTGTQTQIITLNSTALTINQTTDATYGTGAVSTLTSTIVGTGSLTKNGTARLNLSSANTYSGGTTLNAGTLQLGIASVGTVGSITSSAIGNGTLNLSGGTLSSNGTVARTILNAVTVGGDVTLGNATNNGTLTFSAATNLNGATRQLTTASDVQFDGIISNGGLTKSGTGNLTLSAANTYTGNTTVSGGTLLVNGSTAAASTFSVSSGATLGGNGTIGGNVTIQSGGTFAPGNSPGLLTVGSLTLNATSNTAYEINSSVRGTGYDATNITNTTNALVYGGNFSITFGSSFLAAGSTTVFDLFSFTTGQSSSSFNAISILGGYTATLTNESGTWSGLDSLGNSFSFAQSTGDLTVVAIPEAETALGLLACTLLLAYTRWNRRRQQAVRQD